MTHVTSDQVYEALRVLDCATVSMCESLVHEHGSQRAAAKAIGVSTVHFNRMSKGHAQASRQMLESMCESLEAVV